MQLQAQQDSVKGKLIITAEPGIRELQERYISANGEKLETDGYRVQIYNGKRSDCMRERAAFLNKVPDIPIYTIYDAPEYKIQVGNFRSRLEAEKLLTELIEDFRGSFVVKTKIEFPDLKEEPQEQ